MKKNKLALIGFGMSLLFILAACAPKSAPEAVVSQPAVEETALPETTVPEARPTVETTSEVAATAVDMEAFIREKVSGNHDLDRIFNANKTREEWNTTLDRMIGYGAKINEQEKQMIIDYLLSR